MAWTTRIIAGLVAALALAGSAAAQSYDGDWEGVLQAGPQKLRLELHVKTVDGQPSVVLDSLDQGASIPATAAKIENGELDVLFLNIGGELRVKASADGATLTGVWSQGRDAPLTLTRKPAVK
jgi:uncharacterized protein